MKCGVMLVRHNVDQLIELQKKIFSAMTFSYHDAHTEPLLKHYMYFNLKLVIQRIALLMLNFPLENYLNHCYSCLLLHTCYITGTQISPPLRCAQCISCL